MRVELDGKQTTDFTTKADGSQLLFSMFLPLFAGFDPLLLGLLAGATGFFLIVYSLIIHFCKTENAG